MIRIVLILLIMCTSCQFPKKGHSTTNDPTSEIRDGKEDKKITKSELIFQTGFEPDTRIVDQTSLDAQVVGADLSLSTLNTWKNHLKEHPNIGYFNIQYQGGNNAQRSAEIVPDPTNGSNKVLKFWIKEPNIQGKRGRVQANVYENKGIKKLLYSVRLFIPNDLEQIKKLPFKVKWLTLMEFWNNANWSDEEYRFRISVNLQKWSETSDELRIGIKSQIGDSPFTAWQDKAVWEYINHDYVVPIGKWLTINVYFEEGNQENGRFIFSITPEGEETVIVHDIHNTTQHPQDPNPNGLGHFNPMKLYTSAKLIEALNQGENLLHVYWDDFRLSISEKED